jgi:diguanylate cyclase (GGDEF)-like protein
LRYGGDEFVCVLANVDSAEAAARFHRVNAALAARPMPGSVSVGITEAEGNETLDDLVGRADEVMYLGRKQRRTPQR